MTDAIEPAEARALREYHYQLFREKLNLTPTEAYEFAGMLKGGQADIFPVYADYDNTPLPPPVEAAIAAVRAGIDDIGGLLAPNIDMSLYANAQVMFIFEDQDNFSTPFLFHASGSPCCVVIPHTWSHIVETEGLSDFLARHELNHQLHVGADGAIEARHPAAREHADTLDALDDACRFLSPSDALDYLDQNTDTVNFMYLAQRVHMQSGRYRTSQRLRERQSDVTAVASGGPEVYDGFETLMDLFEESHTGGAIEYALFRYVHAQLDANGTDAAAEALAQLQTDPHVLRPYVHPRARGLVTTIALEELAPRIANLAGLLAQQLEAKPDRFPAGIKRFIDNHPSAQPMSTMHPIEHGRGVAVDLVRELQRYEDYLSGDETAVDRAQLPRLERIAQRLTTVQNRLAQEKGKPALPATEPVRLYISTLDLLAGKHLSSYVQSENERRQTGGAAIAALG